jgi:hypothetical protein
VTRSLGLLAVFVGSILAGCAGAGGAVVPEPQHAAPAAKAPVVTVAATAEAPAVSPALPTTVIARGAPVTAYDGAREENAFYAPVSLALRDGSFDLIIHFHGGHQTAIDALEQSGLPVALVNVDLGVDSIHFRSSHYRELFDNAEALEHLIAFAEREVRRSGRATGTHVGRIAISAWSAGYGAARSILRRPADAARVDALLLVDGLYADWENKRAKRVDPEDLAGAMAFARRAVAGEKLFVLTHTAIDGASYAGGPQSTDFLLRFLELDKGPARAGQRKTGGALQYAVDVEGLHVRGFSGKKWADHVEQHRAMGELHYAELRKRWL